MYITQPLELTISSVSFLIRANEAWSKEVVQSIGVCNNENVFYFGKGSSLLNLVHSVRNIGVLGKKTELGANVSKWENLQNVGQVLSSSIFIFTGLPLITIFDEQMLQIYTSCETSGSSYLCKYCTDLSYKRRKGRRTHSSSMLLSPKKAPSISFVMPFRCIFNDFSKSSPLKVRLSTTLILLRFNSLGKKSESGSLE